MANIGTDIHPGDQTCPTQVSWKPPSYNVFSLQSIAEMQQKNPRMMSKVLANIMSQRGGWAMSLATSETIYQLFIES